MACRTLRALSLGATARAALFPGPFEGEVATVHKEVINVASDLLPLLMIVDQELGNHPAAIVIPRGSLVDVGVSRCNRVFAAGGLITIGDALQVDLVSAKLWSSPSIQKERICASGVLGRRLDLAGELCTARCSKGLGRLHRYRAQLARGIVPSFHEEDLVARLASEILAQTIVALKIHDGQTAVDLMGNVIGLGIGLTPSADDVLSGMLGTLVRLAKSGAYWTGVLPVADEIACYARGKTTLVSESYLVHACHGDLSQTADGFLVSMLCGREDEWQAAMARLLSFGASSGSEMVLGILLALDLWLGMA